VDKRLRYTSPKLPSATSFIRKTLGNIAEKLKESSEKLGKNRANLGDSRAKILTKNLYSQNILILRVDKVT
jgi:hypothetical protein